MEEWPLVRGSDCTSKMKIFRKLKFHKFDLISPEDSTVTQKSKTFNQAYFAVGTQQDFHTFSEIDSLVFRFLTRESSYVERKKNHFKKKISKKLNFKALMNKNCIKSSQIHKEVKFCEKKMTIEKNQEKTTLEVTSL